MKKVFNLFLAHFLTLFVAFVSNTALGATGADNGTHLENRFSGSAWFLGPKFVSYCLQVDSQWSPSPVGDLEESVKTALDTWSEYARQRLSIQDMEWGPSINFKLEESCDRGTDLEFLFGVENAKVMKAKENYNSPLGFAHQTEYSPRTGRGKGFVWIAANGTHGLNLENQDLLNTLLLHEVGHIFGVGHLNETVMRKDLISFLQNSESHPEYLSKIDHFSMV